MKKIRVLQLAYNGALANWDYEKAYLAQDPESEVAQARTQAAWEDLQEICEMLREEQDKEEEDN